MPVAYRLIKTKHAKTPLSTYGAWAVGGRWNPSGVHVLYTSSSPVLAMAEVMAHLEPVRYDRIAPHLLLVLELPDNWFTLSTDQLPTGWRGSDPASIQQCRQALDHWLQKPDYLVAVVPSAIDPRSTNLLVHGGHGQVKQVRILEVEAFSFDQRLWKYRENPDN